MNSNAKIAAVTGATGLLGSRLVFDLLQKGYKVKALKRKNSQSEQLKNLFRIWGNNDAYNKIDWVEGDVLDFSSVHKLINGVSYFFHCAATVSFDPKDQAKMMEINVSGTKNVIIAALNSNIKKLCHTSSVAALGRIQRASKENFADENSPWEESSKTSNYSRSKYLAEKEIWAARDKGLKFVIVNPSVIIGAALDQRSSAMLFSAVYNGNPFYTEGINGFVDLRDVSAAMIGLSESKIEAERFIVSEGNYPYRYIFELIAENLNKRKPFIKLGSATLNLIRIAESFRSKILKTKPIITMETARTALSQHLYSNQKLKEALRFEFTPIEESIKFNSKVFIELKKNQQ